MKKVDNIVKITRFEEWKFWIDIIETEDEFEAWITQKNYSISQFMFGTFKKQDNGHDVNFDDFVEMVEANLDDDIIYYLEEQKKWDELD